MSFTGPSRESRVRTAWGQNSAGGFGPRASEFPSRVVGAAGPADLKSRIFFSGGDPVGGAAEVARRGRGGVVPKCLILFRLPARKGRWTQSEKQWTKESLVISSRWTRKTKNEVRRLYRQNVMCSVVTLTLAKCMRHHIWQGRAHHIVELIARTSI